LTGVTFHDLRHAAASRLINGGLDPVTVASVLGHENANITLGIYSHLYDRSERTRRAGGSRVGGLDVCFSAIRSLTRFVA